MKARHITIAPRLALIVLMVVVANSCVAGNRAFRSDVVGLGTSAGPCETCSFHELNYRIDDEEGDSLLEGSYSLGFVELDDRGWLFDRRQLERVLADYVARTRAGSWPGSAV